MSHQTIIDLHAHSTASDGELTPTELVVKAVDNSVNILALTDHDTVSGLAEAQTAASRHNITLINGIEFSTRWDNKTIHIVGLNIDAENNTIFDATIHLNKLREERAIKIGEKLEKVGIENAYENTKIIAGDGTVTRQHFSQFLVNNGHAKSQADVFKRFLVNNKPGYVSVNWPSLDETINNITNAGGVAVIAHPLRYKMTATKLRKLISEFKDSGGKAIEVVTGNNNQNEITTMTNYAKRYDMAGSVGSDYHNANTPWAQLGKLSGLPQGLTPVWELW
ncbi:MAG TPA: PHP domain-containing protein [Thiotrichaceae bacterium]|jgi:predicted metal-dependent phosphoesterase TrpH|nr:PHP domain-containing protein [Thiotrichaceae bacterium]HIM08372.1 PHP domain-containing protein [Gammaproteobacteria bacterium]